MVRGFTDRRSYRKVAAILIEPFSSGRRWTNTSAAYMSLKECLQTLYSWVNLYDDAFPNVYDSVLMSYGSEWNVRNY